MWLLIWKFVLEPACNVRQPSKSWLHRLVKWVFLSSSSARKPPEPASFQGPFSGKHALSSLIQAGAAEPLEVFEFVQITEVNVPVPRSSLLGFFSSGSDSERCLGVMRRRQSWETDQQISAVISVATPITSGTEKNSLQSELGWEGQVEIHKIMRKVNFLQWRFITNVSAWGNGCKDGQNEPFNGYNDNSDINNYYE